MDVTFTSWGRPDPPWERGRFRARFDPPWPGRRWRMGRGAWGPWGAPGPRARRGDVRAAVLTLLAERPMHGYQVIQELEGRTGGAWRVSPGSVYPTLQLLEDEGLIAGQEVEGRRVYALTEAGRARVEAMREQGQAAPWEEVAAEEGPFGGLRRAAFQLAAATMQVAQAGSKDQVERAVATLDEARRKIYTILAEGGQG
jgi:DNA-binding PadR family transcriptional regulator